MRSNFESTLSNMSTNQLHELKSKVTNTIQIPFAIREMLSIKLILRVIISNRLRHQITNKLKELWTKSASTACNKGSTLNVEMSLIIVYLIIVPPSLTPHLTHFFRTLAGNEAPIEISDDFFCTDNLIFFLFFFFFFLNNCRG